MTVVNRVPVPDEVRSDIHTLRVAVMDRVMNGEIPPYALFVNNLMSGKTTIAEDLIHAAAGLSGECGEVLDIIKKVWAYDKPLDLGKLLEEMGDQRFYYQALLNLLGVTDQDVVAGNMVKLMKRFPDGVFNATQAIAQADKHPQAAPAPAPAPPVAPLPMGNRKFIGQKPAPESQQSPNAAQDSSSPSAYMKSVMAKAAEQEAQGNNPVPMTQAEKDRIDNAGEMPSEVQK